MSHLDKSSLSHSESWQGGYVDIEMSYLNHFLNPLVLWESRLEKYNCGQEIRIKKDYFFILK